MCTPWPFQLMFGVINLNLKTDGMWGMKFYLLDPQGPHTSLRSHCCSVFALEEDWSNHLGSGLAGHPQPLPPEGYEVVDLEAHGKQTITLCSSYKLSTVHPFRG